MTRVTAAKVLKSPRALSAGAGLALYGSLGLADRSNALRGPDRAVRRIVGPKRSKAMTNIARGITSMAAPHVHPIVAGALALAVGRLRGRGAPSIVFASLAVTGLDKLSRMAVHQKRPRKAARHKGLDRYAYPSGHTCAMTAIGVAAASEFSEIATPEMTAIAWTIVATTSLAVGWSRLYLDEHWLDDVVGGWSAGMGLGVGAVTLADRLFPGGADSRAFNPTRRHKLTYQFP